jgi:hypothetical protein
MYQKGYMAFVEESHMQIDSSLIAAVAALITSISGLIWTLRRRV